MHCTRQITDSIVWVGGSDRRLALFENLFPLPRGVAYNSYLILDEKTALMDTVDSSITRQFLENILHTLNGRPWTIWWSTTWSRIIVPALRSCCCATRT